MSTGLEKRQVVLCNCVGFSRESTLPFMLSESDHCQFGSKVGSRLRSHHEPPPYEKAAAGGAV